MCVSTHEAYAKGESVATMIQQLVAVAFDVTSALFSFSFLLISAYSGRDLIGQPVLSLLCFVDV